MHADFVPGVRGYLGQNATRLAAQYESGPFEQIHGPWLRFLPPKGAKVLDIGAGSGRDADALCKRGYIVAAVEPSVDMINEAKRFHSSSDIEWIQDHLPQLETLVRAHRTFDLLLLSAVWMHLDFGDRSRAMGTLPKLMNQGAITVITIRHPHDASRHMFEVDPQETLNAAGTCGLRALMNETVQDPIPTWGRGQVSWSLLVFRNEAA